MNKIIKLNFKILPVNFINKKINKNIKKLSYIIKTRFPPEANGALHIGHIKSIILNIETAKIYNGIFNIRIDDTNPRNNKLIYLRSIINDIKWVIKNYKFKFREILYTSNYFHKLYQYAELLIKKNLTYKKNNYKIDYKIYKNLKIFRKMREGWYKEKLKTLKLNTIKINLIIYRIIYKKHYHVKYNWFIFPMYDYSHCLSDKIENIKYSFCSLEFLKNKIFYKSILNIFYKKNNPSQIEFSRLNINYNVTSKKKLLLLKKKNYIKNLKDPRLYSINGIKKRGLTQDVLILFYKNLGINKKENYISNKILENFTKIVLKFKSKEIIILLDLLILIIDNYPFKKIERIKIFKNNKNKNINKIIYFSKEIFIEKSNFIKKNITNKLKLINLNQDFKLKYSHYIIRCGKFEKNKFNKIKCLHCNIINDNKKIKNIKVISWVNKSYNNKIFIKLYKELFIKKIIKINMINMFNFKSNKTICAIINNFYIKYKNYKFYCKSEENKYYFFNKKIFKLNKPIFNNIF